MDLTNRHRHDALAHYLSRLVDVDLTGLADGVVLVYDATSKKWIVGTAGGDSLWEEVTGDLHPVAAPDSLTVTTADTISLSTTNGGEINLTTTFGGDVSLLPDGDVNIQPATGGIFIQVSGGNYIQIFGLPTSNPGGTGRVWNSGGTLKIT